jgi:isochorismate synthase
MATRAAAGALLASEPLVLAHPGPVVLSLAVPAISPLALWDLLPGEDAAFWRAPAGRAAAAAGVALRVPIERSGPGASTDAALGALARSLLRLEVVDGTGVRATPAPDRDRRGGDGSPIGGPFPRLFGGAAFDRPPASPEWASFGPGDVTLPAWTLEETADGARLTAAFPADRDSGDAARRLRETVRLLERLRGMPADGAGPRPLPEVAERSDLDPGRWDAMVARGREAILAGGIRKVVLARRAEVRFARRLDPVAVLLRLLSSRDEFVFGFRRDDAAFVGASPETLLTRRGRRLRVEALAGTCRLPPGPDRSERLALAAELLYGSGKDLGEHALVVRGIVDVLAPFAARRILPEWPRVRGLRELAHLSSEIEAELREEVGSAALLGVLHPTPAVGGLPREAALRLIAAVEPVERGWYAGPVGWLSPDGDAELAVAIRSALLRGDTAWLYAGAGIVAASDAAAEYRETEDKLGRLLAALGAEGGGR